MFVCNYGVKDCARPCAGKGGHTRTLHSQKRVVADRIVTERIALLNGNQIFRFSICACRQNELLTPEVCQTQRSRRPADDTIWTATASIGVLVSHVTAAWRPYVIAVCPSNAFQALFCFPVRPVPMPDPLREHRE